MKIYFAGSIRGGREDVQLYWEIIEYLRNFGEVLTEHVGDQGITINGDDGPTDRYIHDRDLSWLKTSDVLIAEVTTVSMGVGYEIGRAIELGKKVLCLYRTDTNKKLSAMIAGCPDIILAHYKNPEQARKYISDFLRTYI